MLVKAVDQGRAFLTFLTRFPLCLAQWLCVCIWVEPAPLTGSFKDLLHLDKFLVEMEGGMGGGLTHPCLHHLVKWLRGRVWDFLPLGGPTGSVSKRVVKLTVSHYYLAPLPRQREAMGMKSESLSCS